MTLAAKRMNRRMKTKWKDWNRSKKTKIKTKTDLMMN